MKSVFDGVDRKDGMALALAMLTSHPMQYLGVIGLDGKPRVKAFEFKFAEDGKLWFDTIRGSGTWEELSVHPFVQLSVADGESLDWLRVSGKARFVDDGQKRRQVLAASPILRGQVMAETEKEVMPFTLDDVIIEAGNLRLGWKKMFAL